MRTITKEYLSMMLKQNGVSVIAVILISLLFCFLGLFFSGCAASQTVEIIKTIEVKVPVSCDIATPLFPSFSVILEDDDINIAHQKRLDNEARILVYAEELETSLKICKGGFR